MKRLSLFVALSLALLGAATPVFANTVYVVKPGDTLSQIAVQTGISMQAIIAANKLTNPNLLFAGENLVIPDTSYVPPASGTVAAPAALPAVVQAGATQGTYKIVAGDTLYKVSRMYGVTLDELMAANHLTSYIIFLGQVLVIPVHGAAIPTPTPTPAAAAAAVVAPAGPVYSSRGINGIAFQVENPAVGVNDQMWFDFQVADTGGTVDYSVLSIHSDAGISGQSWTYSHLNGGQGLTWRDHIQIGTPGTYAFYLAICYASKPACLANQAPWERLSPDVIVQVTNPGPWTGFNSRGIVANQFYIEGATHYSGDPIWFDFQVTNTNNWTVPYSILSAQVSGVRAGQSWTNSHLNGSQVLTWRDHIDGLGVGTYAFYLAICYNGKDQCNGSESLWDRLSNNIYVTVINH